MRRACGGTRAQRAVERGTTDFTDCTDGDSGGDMDRLSLQQRIDRLALAIAVNGRTEAVRWTAYVVEAVEKERRLMSALPGSGLRIGFFEDVAKELGVDVEY